MVTVSVAVAVVTAVAVAVLALPALRVVLLVRPPPHGVGLAPPLRVCRRAFHPHPQPTGFASARPARPLQQQPPTVELTYQQRDLGGLRSSRCSRYRRCTRACATWSSSSISSSTLSSSLVQSGWLVTLSSSPPSPPQPPPPPLRSVGHAGWSPLASTWIRPALSVSRCRRRNHRKALLRSTVTPPPLTLPPRLPVGCSYSPNCITARIQTEP